MVCTGRIILVIFLLFLTIINFSYCEDSKSSSQSTTDKKKVNTKRKPSPHDKWNNLDEGKLSKEWEEGDEEDELEHEIDRIRKVKKAPSKFGDSGGGGAMVFIELFENNPQGKPWTKQTEARLASKWKTMTRNGSLDVDVFNITDLKLMINLMKNWQLKEVMNFIALQPEVKSFRYNNVDYDPKTFLASDEDDDDL